MSTTENTLTKRKAGPAIVKNHNPKTELTDQHCLPEPLNVAIDPHSWPPPTRLVSIPGHHMMVDKTTIQTRLRIPNELFDAPSAYIQKHGIQVRTSKPSKGRCRNGPTQNLTLDVLAYKGIKAKLRKVSDDPLTDVTIDFNPGVCLYSHNGQIISVTEFVDALCVLVTHLKPLLSDPKDEVDLVPGFRAGGPAYWSLLEVPFQCLDPKGILLAGFRHLRHPSIRIPTRHWETSIGAGGKRSKLVLSIYLKAFEMVAHGKLPEERLDDYRDVLRLEARMREEKLVHYFGNERNVEVIEGVKRLVRFYPQDLIRGHRACFSELEGVYTACGGTVKAGANPRLAPLGRILAMAALDTRTAQAFPELLSHLKFYTGASSDTIKGIREAGMAELSRRSPIAKDHLLSDAAYNAQPGIVSEEREEQVRHEIEDTSVKRLIHKAYRPPGQPFQPITQWPPYLLP